MARDIRSGKLHRNWLGSSRKEGCIVLDQLGQCSLYDYVQKRAYLHVVGSLRWSGGLKARAVQETLGVRGEADPLFVSGRNGRPSRSRCELNND
jgi:hypothetical protein